MPCGGTIRSPLRKTTARLLDGNLLLGFSLHAMILLSTVQGSGALEHPAEPTAEKAASICRLPLMQFIISLPILFPILNSRKVC